MNVIEAFNRIQNRKFGQYMATANPHSLVVASRDPLFKEALKNADILLPDGTGIVLASRLLKNLVKEKVAGTNFFMCLTKYADSNGGLKYFFLGSSDEVLTRICNRFKKDYPSINICGTYSPPFKETFSDADNEKMLKCVNEAKPDVLWVGMTAPKQEKWIYENRNKLNVPFIGAIGAAFDFYAGTKARSSLFWQKLGLEWFPRLIREPGRLWERNFKSTPVFLGWIIKEKVRKVFSREGN